MAYGTVDAVECHARGEATESTLTEVVTFPAMRAGVVLLTLTTLKIVSTEKGASVVSVLSIEIALSWCLVSMASTGTTTFPVLRTGTVLLSLTTLKIVSTEKVVSVLFVFEIGDIPS
jgi:hypothetical protein